MKKIFSLMLLSFVILFFSSCGKTTETIETQIKTTEDQETVETGTKQVIRDVKIDPIDIEIEGFLKHTDSTLSYTVSYPKNYTKKLGFQGTSSLFLSPLDSETDNFAENFNILVQAVDLKDSNSDKYVKDSIDGLLKMIKNGKVLENKKIKLAGSDAYKLVYTGDMGEFKLKWLQILAFKGDKLYVLTYTGKESDFDKYLETMNKISNSFSYLK